ncbi:hypothetical protein B0T25DRAFT_246874 [Lasiosphaeria hispida]|uniref:Uncharacterized protein n=1 Tax=Lasiosphaeria hispida TaxID=260671 RepID=A0AAJ0HEZ4_9PEZI|nr:hypothetical protein B0T25DRAFT_246874 [Lasiosphaeria hispida]
MAPVNGAAKQPAETAGRRTISKPVVPVLPLNYPQRPTVKQTSAPPKSSPLAEIQPNRQATEGKAEKVEKPAGAEKPHENGGGQSEKFKAAPAPTENVAATASSALRSHHAVTVTAVPELSSVPVGSSGAASTATPTVIAAHPGHGVASPMPTRPLAPTIPSSKSPSLYGPIHDPGISIIQASMAMRPFHQAHPSNGSLVFGGFQDSNASSPAPHSGGGYAAPNMMYPPVGGMDGYGRPILVTPALDGFPPGLMNMNNHSPPTPHSFHGSQSSLQIDEHGFSQYPSVNGHGHNGYSAEPVVQPPLHMPGGNAQLNGSIHPPASASVFQNLRGLPEQDDSIAFLNSGVEDNTFNDCIIEMHFPDSPHYQDHPDYNHLRQIVTMPGHRFILSRSRTLAGIMKAQHTAPGGRLVLNLHGEYLRSDVFCCTLRTLYGWSVGDGIPPTELRLRDVRDDFNLALSYIATAQYLQLGWVHSASVQRASRMLFWETIELAVNFVLPNIVLSSHSRHAEFSLMGLLGPILHFIVKNFPKDFVLDVNAGGYGFTRLPIVAPPQNQNPATIAHGTTGGQHSRQTSKSQSHILRNTRVSTNPRLSSIKFGDLSPPERNGYGGAAPPETTQSRRAPSPHEALLSRILLNLPYELLKQVLEDPNLAGISGELNPFARQTIIGEIIAEREARRLRTLDKANAQLQFLQEALEKAAAPLVVEQMGDFLVNNMGFKEEMCLGDVPFLVHTWCPPNSGSLSA